MTAYAQYTAEALRRYDFGQYHQTATVADNGGDVIVLADGRIGVVATLGGGTDAVAIGDPECAYTTGVYDIAAASGLVLAQGAKAYWDPVALAIVAAGGGANGAVYAGLVVQAKVSGQTSVRVDVNATSPAQSSTQVSTVAAAGSAIGNATAITAGGFVLVTGANNATGVQLTGSQSVKIKNSSSAGLYVYPPTGGAINALAANASINMAANTVAEFIAYNTTQFYTDPLVPS